MIPDPAEQPTMTVPEVAAVLGISRAQGYEGVRTGEIPSIKIGRRIVIPTAKVRQMLDSDVVPNGTQASRPVFRVEAKRERRSGWFRRHRTTGGGDR